MFDEAFVRAWRLYLAGSQAAFTTGSMQLFQVVFARGASNAIPWTRDQRDGSAGRMDTCDVLIVGGGPAGSTCAWKLRQAGLDVVVDGRGGLSARQGVRRVDHAAGRRRTLELDVSTELPRDGRTFQPITGFRVGLIGGRDEVDDALRSPGQLRDSPLRVRSLPAAAIGCAVEAR